MKAPQAWNSTGEAERRCTWLAPQPISPAPVLKIDIMCPPSLGMESYPGVYLTNGYWDLYLAGPKKTTEIPGRSSTGEAERRCTGLAPQSISPALVLNIDIACSNILVRQVTPGLTSPMFTEIYILLVQKNKKADRETRSKRHRGSRKKVYLVSTTAYPPCAGTECWRLPNRSKIKTKVIVPGTRLNIFGTRLTRSER